MSARTDIGSRATAPRPHAADSGASRPRSRRPAVALFVIATAQLMVVLDATIVNVALPRIQRTLGFSGKRPGVGRQRLCAQLRRWPPPCPGSFSS